MSRSDLTKTLDQLHDLVSRGKLPPWLEQRLADAIGPEMAVVARWLDRATYGCPRCDDRFETAVGLRRHGREAHGLGFDGQPAAGAQCDAPGCGVYCEDHTALFHHKARRHGAVGLRVVEGGRA